MFTHENENTEVITSLGKEVVGIVNYLTEYRLSLQNLFSKPVLNDKKQEIAKNLFAYFENKLIENHKYQLSTKLNKIFMPIKLIYDNLEFHLTHFSSNYDTLFLSEQQFQKLAESDLKLSTIERIISQLRQFILCRDLMFKIIAPSSLALNIISNNNLNPQNSLTEEDVFNNLFFDENNEYLNCKKLTGRENILGYFQGMLSKVSQILTSLKPRIESLIEMSERVHAWEKSKFKIKEIKNELGILLSLENKYCDDIYRFIEEEKSIQIIYPSVDEYKPRLKSWKEKAKKGHILFIFEPERKNWIAILKHKIDVEQSTSEEAFESKTITSETEVGISFYLSLVDIKSEGDISRIKPDIKQLLRAHKLFMAETPFTIKTTEISYRTSMATWNDSLNVQISSPSYTKTEASFLSGFLLFMPSTSMDMKQSDIISMESDKILQLMVNVFREQADGHNDLVHPRVEGNHRITFFDHSSSLTTTDEVFPKKTPYYKFKPSSEEIKKRDTKIRNIFQHRKTI